MDEAEWLACTDPQAMLGVLHGKANDRKLRLFACACCRRVWHLLTDERSRKAVHVGELYADGLADQMEAQAALDEAETVFRAVQRAFRKARGRGEQLPRALHAMICARLPVWPEQNFHTAKAAADAVLAAATHAENNYLLATLQDVFGPLFFRSVSVAPACLRWNHAAIPAIARHIYDDRAFHDLPILADALEDAGCTDAAILDHCRGPGPHVRGCWVVDLILGRS